MSHNAYRLSCRGYKLDNKDGLLGKSDPYVRIHAESKVVAKSNIVMNNLNPTWDPFVVEIDACGGMKAPLEVRVYDYDEDGTHDFIGSFGTTLEQLVSQAGASIPLINPNKKGLFAKKEAGKFSVFKAEPITITVSDAYSITFAGTKLSNKDGMFGKSDPFLVVEKVTAIPDGERIKRQHVFVAMTEQINNNLNPNWAPLLLNSRACGGLDQQLRLSVYDFDHDGTHDLIGHCFSTLRELTLGGQRWPLLDPYKQGGMGYKNSGELHVKTATPSTIDPMELNVQSFLISLKGEKFTDLDMFSKSDPVLKIYASNGTLLYQSEVIKNNLNPSFNPFTLTVEQCGGLDGSLLLQFDDHDSLGKNDVIGYLRATLRKLWVHQQRSIKLLIRNKKQMQRGDNKGSGRLLVLGMTPTAGSPASSAPPSTTAAAGGGAAAAAAGAYAPPPGYGAPGGAPPPYGYPGGYPPPGAYASQAPGTYPPPAGGAYPPPAGGAYPGAYASQAPGAYPPPGYPGAYGGAPAWEQQQQPQQYGYPGAPGAPGAYPPPGYGAPPPGYPGAYASQAPGAYPPPGYGAPPPGYGAPPPGYPGAYPPPQ